PKDSNAFLRINAAAPEHQVVSPVSESTAFGCSRGVCRASQMAIRASDSARASNRSRQFGLSSASGFKRNRNSPRPSPARRFMPRAKPLFRKDREKNAGNGNSSIALANTSGVPSTEPLSRKYAVMGIEILRKLATKEGISDLQL